MTILFDDAWILVRKKTNLLYFLYISINKFFIGSFWNIYIYYKVLLWENLSRLVLRLSEKPVFEEFRTAYSDILDIVNNKTIRYAHITYINVWIKQINAYDTVSDHGYTPVPKSVLQKFFTSRCPTVKQNISKSS